MIIYLLDRDEEMIKCWNEAFRSEEHVKIIHEDFVKFMKEYHGYIDGIVAPGNSFGYMDGGYDKAIIDYFGPHVQTNVSTLLDSLTDGYQQVGTCIAVPFDIYTILYTPTMRFPERIIDSRIIFDCMLNCLKSAEKSGCNSVVIPAFGACTGNIDKEIVANLMKLGYDYFKYKRKPGKNTYDIDWDYVRNFKRDLEKVQGYKINRLDKLQDLEDLKQSALNSNHITYQLSTEPSFLCSCGGIICKDKSKVLTSNPPKYEYVCDKCGDKYYLDF